MAISLPLRDLSHLELPPYSFQIPPPVDPNVASIPIGPMLDADWKGKIVRASDAPTLPIVGWQPFFNYLNGNVQIPGVSPGQRFQMPRGVMFDEFTNENAEEAFGLLGDIVQEMQIGYLGVSTEFIAEQGSFTYGLPVSGYKLITDYNNIGDSYVSFCGIVPPGQFIGGQLLGLFGYPGYVNANSTDDFLEAYYVVPNALEADLSTVRSVIGQFDNWQNFYWIANYTVFPSMDGDELTSLLNAQIEAASAFPGSAYQIEDADFSPSAQEIADKIASFFNL